MAVLGGRFGGRVPVRARWVLAAGGMVAVLAGGTLAGTAAIPAAAQDPVPYLFVSSGNSVTEYAQGATGDAAPLATISGSSTGIDGPFGIAVDASGDLFVADYASNSVTEYAPGATGNIAPAATISGSSTGIDGPLGLALDASGDLFVANFLGNSVTEYAPGANGNIAPVATISGASTGIDGSPTGIAVDASGNLFVASQGNNSVTEYAPGANGDVAPVTDITGCCTMLHDPIGMAVDASGDTFVVNPVPAYVTEYAQGATGDASPIATLSGASTGLDDPGGMAVDALGNLFVANDGNNSVTEYAPESNGNVAPVATLSGPDTGLNDPVWVAVAPTFVPGAPTGVTATPGNTQISVSWSAPGSDGGQAITGYTVSAQAGGTTITQTLNNPSATSAVISGLTNGTAYDITVAAINAVGAGPAAAFSGNPVTPTAAAPLITSSSSLAVGVGHKLSFKITAAGKPKPAITESGLPSWATFTPAAAGGSAIVSGTPPTGSGGVYHITFGASNGVGFPVTQNATLSVLAFTSPTSATFPLNQSDSFTVTTSVPSSSVAIALLSGSLPPDVSFTVNSNGTATLSGVPVGKAKTYSMTFKATLGTAATIQKFTLTTTG
jgi:sugar lactone lactonase YvrE